MTYLGAYTIRSSSSRSRSRIQISSWARGRPDYEPNVRTTEELSPEVPRPIGFGGQERPARLDHCADPCTRASLASSGLRRIGGSHSASLLRESVPNVLTTDTLWEFPTVPARIDLTEHEIWQAMNEAGGVPSRAAALLDVSPQTLRRRLKQLPHEEWFESQITEQLRMEHELGRAILRAKNRRLRSTQYIWLTHTNFAPDACWFQIEEPE